MRRFLIGAVLLAAIVLGIAFGLLFAIAVVMAAATVWLFYSWKGGVEIDENLGRTWGQRFFDEDDERER